MPGHYKQRVVLVNPPNKRIVLRDMYSSTISKGAYNWPCIDLLVLSGVLRQHYDVTLIDANTAGLSLEEAVETVSSFNPAGICFAFGNSVKDEDYFFVARLRARLPFAKIVGTGGLLYHNAEDELSRHPEFDACLLNFTTRDIAAYLEDEFSGLNNMVYRRDGRIIRAPLRYPENGFQYAFPLHEQLPLKKYRLSNGRRWPLTSVLTSFGCPGSCSFCVSEKIEYRYRDPQNVIDELRGVRDLGVREIVFRDNIFCASRKQGHEIMELMLQHKLNLSWVAETRANVVNEETAGLMKRSGCHALHVGVESGTSGLLEKYKKGVGLEQIKTAFRICRKLKIQTVGYFILGLPGETREDMRRTIDLARELDCDYASFNVLIPIVGTSLRAEAEKRGWLRHGDIGEYDGSLGSLIATPEFTREDISALTKGAYKKFYFRPRYFVKAVSRCRNLYQLRMLVSDFFRFMHEYMHG